MLDPDWQRLRAVAGVRFSDRRRRLVPCVGSGFNAQAGRRINWRDLLVQIVEELGVAVSVPDAAALTGHATLFWESILNKMSRDQRRRPHSIENELRTIIARVLNRAYPAGGPTARLAGQFLAQGFADVVSFNFDQGLFVDRGGEWTRRDEKGWSVHDFARTSCGTRVWYPHGTVKSPASIRLGVRAYSNLIDESEIARRSYKTVENGVVRRHAARLQAAELMDLVNETMRSHRVLSWVSVLLNRPLLFLGMSLGREEWPLWWALVQRRRNLARRNLDVPAFALLSNDEAKAQATALALAGLTPLTFSSHAEGWRQVFLAMEPAT